MNKPIVAIYDDIVTARQVVEDLVNANFERDTISFVTNDAHNQYSHFLDKGYTAREDAVTAGEGAGFGAVVGALTGVLVGLAALTIPGLGIAIVAGPIVAGLTGAVAGALTGGVVGALVKSGVPEDEAPYYAEGIRRGGTLVSVQTSDTLRAQDIMNRHGSINIHERVELWRQAGWKGFESEIVEDANPKKIPRKHFAPIQTPSTIYGAAPVTPVEPPVVVLPTLENEPSIDDQDTRKSRPVIVTPTPIETIVPVTPIPAVPVAEPIPVVIVKDPQSDYVDTPND